MKNIVKALTKSIAESMNNYGEARIIISESILNRNTTYEKARNNRPSGNLQIIK